MSKNKVKYNIKNVHYAPMTAEGTDTSWPTYSTPVPWPGARSISLEQQGSISKFYADGIVYWQSAKNNGYEGDFESAMVPDSFREGSFGLGAGKLRTVFRIILPSAMPGILSGIILGIGRIVGETAALMFTSGSVAKVAIDPMDSGRTLAVHMYNLLNEGLAREAAYATAVVLLVLVVGINALSSFVARKFTKA